MNNWLGNVTKRLGTIGESNKKSRKAKATKVLADVSPENTFAFATGEGSFTGARAQNLISFYEELKVVDIRSVEFHLYRMDFENWVRNLGDEALALRIAKIRGRQFEGERTRERVVEAVAKGITHLLPG